MGNKNNKPAQRKEGVVGTTPDALLVDLRQLIEDTRSSVAVAVNAGLTLLYWQVGQRIYKELLQRDRAEYAKRILPTLAAKLTDEFGRGWSERSLAYMVRFAETFPEMEILQALCAKLSWTHFKAIIYIDDPLKRDFYAEYKGQMELYLRWLNKHERRPQEEQPLGIILCAGKKQELIELMELGQSGIHIAEYLTQLPPRKLLEQKLHNAVAMAKEKLNARPEDAA